MRDSRFELLRIVAMFIIVLYHLTNIMVFHLGYDCQCIRIPLHIGVICFVLISGYFHIKLSLRGILKLFFPLVMIYLPLELINGGGYRSLFFLSPYWFVRVYFYLMLMSPLLNDYLINNRRRLWLIFTLGFIAVYMPWLGGDDVMENGKNVILFALLYTIGDTIKANEHYIGKMHYKYFVSFFLLLSIALPILYYCFGDDRLFGFNIGTFIWRSSFPYSSPLLIINGILFFIIFSKIHLSSKVVNFFSSSIFAVYIIQEHPLVLNKLLIPCVKNLDCYLSGNLYGMFIGMVCLTVIVIVISICVDKLLSPLWNIVAKKSVQWGNVLKKNYGFDETI